MADQGIESELNGSHLGEIVRVTNPANVKWYDIGLELGLESFILDGIKVQCGPVPSECFREMIKEWLKREESNWRSLQDALRSPTVRESKLAGLLLDKQKDRKDCVQDNGVSSTTTSTQADTDHHLGDIIPYGCGCGDCTFSIFIENGCPKPIGDKSPFPFLNTAGLTENERQMLQGRLYEEFQLISRKFSHLTSAVCQSLIDRNITVKRLVRALRDLKAFQPAKSDSPLLQDRYQELKTAEDIDDVFDVISDYVSFFSFHIVEHIVFELGDATDQQALLKYKEQLEEYCSHNIFECPSYSTTKKGQPVLVLKVDDSIVETYNMKHLHQLTARITKILSLHKYTLHLCSVEKGCVQLVYRLPSFVPEMIFPLSTDQEKEFSEAGFTRLECIQWKYSFGQKAKNGQPSQDVTEPEPLPPVPPKREASKRRGLRTLKPTVIDETALLDNYIWYHGNISRAEAEHLLRKTNEDSFLVRSKQTKGEYALSEVFDGKMKHYMVKKTKGLYELEHSSFNTIPDMVRYLMARYKFKPCHRSETARKTEPSQVIASDWIDPGIDVTGDSDWTGTGEEWTGTGDSGFHTGLPTLGSDSKSLSTSPKSPLSPGKKSPFSERKLSGQSHDKYTSLVKENMNPPQTYTKIRRTTTNYVEPTYVRSDKDDYKDIDKIEQRPPVIYDRVHNVK